MKEYTKPFIEDEEIEIEDICSASTTDGQNLGNPFDFWDEEE